MGKSILADIPGNFFVARLGSVAAIASGGANARLQNCFVAPADLKVLSAWKVNLAADEVTVGTATSSASYRRHTVVNGGTAGTGTAIIASINATASAASLGSRAFTLTTNNTVTSGGIIYGSQLTVGAATADGTDAAACEIQIAYELL